MDPQDRHCQMRSFIVDRPDDLALGDGVVAGSGDDVTVGALLDDVGGRGDPSAGDDHDERCGDRGPRVPSGPQPGGATIRELRLERPWRLGKDVAADAGVRELDVEDAEAARRGEESQDPDDGR